MKKRIKIPIIILGILIGLYVIGSIIESKKEQDPLVKQTLQTEDTESSIPDVVNTEQLVQKTIVSEPKEHSSQNLLIQKALVEVPVINAAKKKIGTRAYIEIPSTMFLDIVTLDDITEFYKSFQGKNYNWISIICSDVATGLVFGSDGNPIASYGKIDEIGRIAGTSMWSIIYDEKMEKFKRLEF